jgi:predicted enzyme related to lactoylglutathione lyase
MANPVVHFEITGGDPAALQAFYRDLLGWKIDNMGAQMGNYGVVDTQGGEGINGAVGMDMAEGQPNYTTIYVAVADPHATLDKAEQLGGKVLVPVTEIPNVVTFALFMDRQSNVIGLVKDGPGGQAPSTGAGAPLGWFEISSGDPKDARAFYTELFGWTVHSETEGDYIYYELHTDERGIGGAIGSSQDGSPRVNLWAKVNDPQAYLTKAEELGGKTVMEPMQVNEGLTVAGFLDPVGNFFGFYRGM